jgi:hypothetical protein
LSQVAVQVVIATQAAVVVLVALLLLLHSQLAHLLKQ